MIDVLLTHSYHMHFDRKQARKMQPYPPLGTLYAAALLRQKGYRVAIFDSMLEDPERGFPEAVARHRPRMVAICEDNFNFLSKMCLTRMREVAFGMIDFARARGATVLVNGSDASDRAADYLEHGADCVLLGEVEWTLVEMVESILCNSKKACREIAGLVYLDPSRRTLTRTAPRPLMRNLDVLPFPARDLVDIGRYKEVWKQAHGYFSLNLVASRGCPYRCNWCAKPIYGDSFHVRTAESVAREMEELKVQYDANHLWFADDTFGLQSKWVDELAGQVEQRQAAVPFKMQCRADLMKESTVNALRHAGCAEVWMGVESGSQKILDAMEKGLQVEQVRHATEILRRAGIRACFFLQFGYPGETWVDIRKTVDLVKQTRPDDIGVSVSYPLPGTRFHARVREQLGEKTNWMDSEDLSMMFQGPYTSEFYRALHAALHAEVATWAAPDGWKPSGPQAAACTAEADLARLHELWALVEQMERQCQSPDPTPLPALAFSGAITG
ncbi:MAG: B12-binding domain-containing radical SAM protein [Acidobacteria bacterium]|nr:B12-binding domain-containing radical SAM protein [Acidobacteriota bacterium]